MFPLPSLHTIAELAAARSALRTSETGNWSRLLSPVPAGFLLLRGEFRPMKRLHRVAERGPCGSEALSSRIVCEGEP